MINPSEFFIPGKRKVKVSVDVKKVIDALDWSELKGKLSTVEELNEIRVSSLSKAVQDFEKWLLEKAIDLKKQRLYVLHYTKRDVATFSLDDYYCLVASKEAAEWQKEEFLKNGISSTICDYDFDKLLKMSDNEFEGLPDLGNKDLARKYRKVMREQSEA